MYIGCMTEKERHIERLFTQHYRAMYRLASALLHDDDESKDVVHDVFARLLVGKLPVKEDSAKAFLLSCVRNQCLNVIRSRNTQQRAIQLLMLDDDFEDKSTEELEGVITILQRGIIELYPPICQEIIRMHFSEGLTFREIALQKGLSERTIYKHLHSALTQLRQTLKNAEQ